MRFTTYRTCRQNRLSTRRSLRSLRQVVGQQEMKGPRWRSHFSSMVMCGLVIRICGLVTLPSLIRRSRNMQVLPGPRDPTQDH
jgi:hypothetical protein